MKTKTFKIFNIDKDIPIPNELFVELNGENIYCSSCKIILQGKSKKRHYDEIHLKIKKACYIFRASVKRLTPHLDIHKKKRN